MDCAVACLAMICGLSYEETLMAFRHNVYVTGATIRQIQHAALRLGYILDWSRRIGDIETETGLLCVKSDLWPIDHLVVIKDGQIIDADQPYATLWDADVYLSVYKAKPVSILKIRQKEEVHS